MNFPVLPNILDGIRRNCRLTTIRFQIQYSKLERKSTQIVRLRTKKKLISFGGRKKIRTRCNSKKVTSNALEAFFLLRVFDDIAIEYTPRPYSSSLALCHSISICLPFFSLFFYTPLFSKLHNFVRNFTIRILYHSEIYNSKEKDSSCIFEVSHPLPLHV